MGYNARVTRKEVAREAGVSETVVSYVTNNNRYVDKEKRARVEAAIEKLGYKPNSIARALKGKKFNHIIFIADNITSEHFSILMNEIDKKAYDLGYMVSLCQNRNTESFVQSIISRYFDGVIISSISFPTEYIQRIIDAGIPVVLIVNRDYSEITGASRIDSGLYEGTKEVVDYLYEKGCKDIVYVDRYSRNDDFCDMADMRYRGFVEQMKKRGLWKDEGSNILTGCTCKEEVSKRVEELLGTKKVDAFFGRNDYLACIAMQKAQEMGFNVPNDIKVIGFDNSSLCQFISPQITSVEIQRAAIAEAAVEMLQKMIEENLMLPSVLFPTKIIERVSTKSS